MALIRPPRFDEWLECYFAPYDNVNSPWERFPNEDWPVFRGSHEEIVDLFTYTMQTSGNQLLKFSNHQLGNGLTILLDGQYGGPARIAANGNVSLEKKIEALKSVEALYRDCLTPRAPAVLGHLDEPGNCPPLSYICYMLWDESPFGYWEERRNSERLFNLKVEVMSSALFSSNDAVIESGLHGLGHTVSRCKAPAIAAIDRFIESRGGHVRDELITYALQARTGVIQ
ncbi:MAG: hypothetical protein HOP09_09030 [Hyphomicrobium sp.]|nr:hypothetical protein [Hyphomicrobium sp.]